MIVNDDYVFISTPKCATHSLYYVLQEYFGGRRIKPYHRREVPESHADRFRFTVVRNPYSRAVCMWWIITNSQRYHENYKWYVRSTSFEAYLKWAMSKSNGVRRLKILTWTQSQWHPEPINYIKLESLQNDFNKLPFVNKKIEMPKLLKRTPNNLKVLTAVTRELIKELCSEDFRRFDY